MRHRGVLCCVGGSIIGGVSTAFFYWSAPQPLFEPVGLPSEPLASEIDISACRRVRRVTRACHQRLGRSASGCRVRDRRVPEIVGRSHVALNPRTLVGKPDDLRVAIGVEGVPVRGFANTRSSSPLYGERPRCSNSSAARREPSAIVRFPAWDFGVSIACRTNVSSIRITGSSGSARRTVRQRKPSASPCRTPAIMNNRNSPKVLRDSRHLRPASAFKTRVYAAHSGWQGYAVTVNGRQLKSDRRSSRSRL
jgi:hypothetical protein